MRIIEAKDVDLIEPFPIGEIPRLVKWLHCYTTVMDIDGEPKTDTDKESYYRIIVQQHPTWGVIDKHNKIGYKHEVPLIGFGYFQPMANRCNAYLHVASSRKAWGLGLIDQAAETLIKHLFEANPHLQRLSGAILNSNSPAKAFAKRIGFQQDGLLKDFVTQNGIPKSVAHFGLLRRNVWATKLPQLEQPAVKTADKAE